MNTMNVTVTDTITGESNTDLAHAVSGMTAYQLENFITWQSDLARYRAELETINTTVANVEATGCYEYWYELLRERSSIRNAINVTELQIAGNLEFTNVVGGLAGGMTIKS